jgi:LacI family transcriptional regulator
VTTRPANRAATINDVARTAGVSRAAVSKVLRDASGVSPAMRQRVTLAIEELGYRPSVHARALRGSSYRLGIEIPHIGARFMTQLVDGAKSALVGTPYQLVVAPADGPEYDALETLADGLVDGIIAISNAIDRGWLEQLARRVPVVMLGSHDEAENYDTVMNDDVLGTELVMQHLFELGHRRIAHVTENESLTAPTTRAPHAYRLQGYVEAMRRAGLESFVEVTRKGAHGTRAATAELLARPEVPTAIFAAHDDMAIDVLAEIADRGHPYADVSVVGYDNTDLAAHPLLSLTSVDQQGPELGRQAVRMLLERIEGRTEPRRYLVKPTLQVRRSTSPARAGA